MKEFLRACFRKDSSGMEEFLNTEEKPDVSRQIRKSAVRKWQESLLSNPEMQKEIQRRQQRYHVLYRIIAVISCILFIAVMLYMIAHLPLYGFKNPRADVVASRYIEKGLEETGAVNVVAAMILDYRAFDTLGESFVLFTALVCTTILLRFGAKDKNRFVAEPVFDTSSDTILRVIGLFLVPCILLFGIYIILNGHLSPGGGFSGGTILGASLIILSASAGFTTTDRIFTYKRLNIMTFAALGFYSLSKGFVFFVGANGMHNPIPKGIPGAILSAGLILPLNIAVGLVVACTMYGFYSLFERGMIGHA